MFQTENALDEARALVTAGYRVILGRDPEPTMLNQYGERLAHQRSEQDKSAFLAGLMASDEALKYNARTLLGRIGLTPRGKERPVIEHVVSLGWNCLPSMTFKRHGLKRYSLPFDWIFSGPVAAQHMIEDDFRTLLDPQHYEAIMVDGHRRCQHRFYKAEMYVDRMFNHYDPTQPEGLSYLTRAVERFRRLLASSAPKLFVMTVPQDKYGYTNVLELHRMLAARTKNIRMQVVVFDPPSGGLTPTMEPIHVGGPLEVLRFGPVANMHEATFEDPLDETVFLRVLSRYELRLTDAP